MSKNERVLTSDLKDHTNKTVTLSGSIYKWRKLGGINFINVRDRSGLAQVMIEDEKVLENLMSPLAQIGTIISVTGKVAADDRAPDGVEVHATSLKVINKVIDTPPIEYNKAIDHKPDNFDTLFEYRSLNLRNINEQLIFRVRASVLKYIREWLEGQDFVEIQTPKLLAGATEGGAEVFKLDYFDQQAFLAQSPQLYKQMMVGVFERVYEIGAAYRAEPSMTTRHLTEVSMLDVELGYIDGLDDVLSISQGLVSYVVSKVWDNHEPELKKLDATKPVLAEEFPRISLEEVHDRYSKANNEDTRGEKDLSPAEERFICDYAKKNLGSEAVFITDWPASEMKFYHRGSDDNPDLALRADLLFRGVELATIPLREYRFEKVIDQMKKAGMDIDDPGYKYFVMAMKYGLPPHGGFGFGIDRFVQYIVGLKNVKEATLFPRDINRLAP